MRGEERGGERDPIGIRQTQKDKGGEGGGGRSIWTLLAVLAMQLLFYLLSFAVDTCLFAEYFVFFLRV